MEYLALSLGAAAGSLVFAALPLSVGAIIALFGSPAMGGVAATVELSAMGVASLLVSWGLLRLPCRATSVLAALLLVAGQVVSVVAAQEHGWALMLAGRTVAGLGEGALFTLCNAWTARGPRPERGFTWIAFAQVLLNSLFFFAMSKLNVPYDPAQAFVIFAVFAALTTLPLAGLPTTGTRHGAAPAEAAAPPRFSPTVKLLLVGFAFYSTALFMLFTYIEDVGVSVGFSHAQVANVLVVSTLCAFFGPGLNAALGLRFGWTLPILAVVAVQAVSNVAVVYVNHLPLWAGIELVSIMLLYVLSPMMFALSARLEPSGRATAYASGIMAITSAIGPAVSAWVLAHTDGHYTALGWLTALTYLAMTLCIWGPLRIADGRRTEPALRPVAEGS